MTDPHLNSLYIEKQFETINSSMDKFYEKLETVASMATQLAVIADRQVQYAETVERCGEMIKSLDKKLTTSIEDVKQKNSDTRKEVDKWINRGVGGWTIALILVTVIQYLIITQIDEFKTASTNMSQTITTIDRRLTKIEATQDTTQSK
jgi:tetrahydromethanopterin S-methyltransferase subunit G